jgi:hypothetical protein
MCRLGRLSFLDFSDQRQKICGELIGAALAGGGSARGGSDSRGLPKTVP